MTTETGKATESRTNTAMRVIALNRLGFREVLAMVGKQVIGIRTETLNYVDLARCKTRYAYMVCEDGERDLGILEHPELLPQIRKQIKGLSYLEGLELAIKLVRD